MSASGGTSLRDDGRTAFPVPRPCRILAFWAGSDFDAFLKPAFLGRPELEVEIVSSRHVGTGRPYAAGIARSRQLRRRLRTGEFDLVIAGNIWRSRAPKHKGFLTRMAKLVRNSTVKRSSLDTDLVPGLLRGLKVPLAAIDIRDSHFVKPWDLPLLRACTAYFKRELFAVPERSLFDLMTWEPARDIQPLTAKLRPLSYGIDPARIPKEARPMAERDVDIFMSGGGKPLRDAIKERVRALGGKYRVVVAEGKVSDADYFEFLQRSRLVICTESFGCETWRQYEVAAAGGVPVINYPFVLHYQPMEPDEHAIFFSLAGRDFERQIDPRPDRPGLPSADRHPHPRLDHRLQAAPPDRRLHHRRDPPAASRRFRDGSARPGRFAARPGRATQGSGALFVSAPRPRAGRCHARESRSHPAGEDRGARDSRRSCAHQRPA